MPPAREPSRRIGWPWLVLALGCGLHVAMTWSAMGGRDGLTNEWPLVRGDHAIHYSHAVAGRDLLRSTGFAAGYDPAFMAGYPLSVLAGSSFTLAHVTLALFRGVDPAVAYKCTVFGVVALLPALMTWAGFLFRLGPAGVAWSTSLYLLYFWSDAPKGYFYLGMIAFLLVVPVGLVALGLLVRFLEGGGRGRWLAAAAGCSAAFLAHLTAPLTLGVAGLVAYLFASTRARRGGPAFPGARHPGFWMLAPAVLVANAFWWLPGWWLRSASGATEFRFVHPELLLGRLGQIFWNEPLPEPLLIGLGLAGLVLLRHAWSTGAVALGGFVLAGFGWGYAAGPFRALDFLEPGRQTYAFYAALCLASGLGLGAVGAILRDAAPGRVDRWLMLALAGFLVRCFGAYFATGQPDHVFGPDAVLSSRPLPVQARLVDGLRRLTRPGDRVLFEETGFGLPGLADPFQTRHPSAALPSMLGVEVIGGPYLHTPVRANFAQFGEGKLFGVEDWGRDQFVRHARLYRPSAIACWTPRARAFCRNNPDLVRVVDEGPDVLLGRVLGFEGAAIRGRARVEAGVNRLVARDLEPDAEGLVVLRYHMAPGLVADPPVPIEPVALEADPVPFIGLRPPAGVAGPVTIRMALPPREGWLSRPTDGGTP